MSLKQFKIDFQELAKEASNRFDVDFVDFNKNERQERYSFRDLFEIENSTKKERMDLIEGIEDDFYYAEIGNVTKQGDVEPEKLNFSSKNELVADYFKKIEKGDIQKVEENNVLLAKVRPNLKKYVFVDENNKDYFYTTAFINLKPKKLNKIFYYSFRTIFHGDLMSISRQGKGYPTLKEDDLYYLKFEKGIVDKLEEYEKSIVAQIKPIEKKIRALKNQIVPAQEVINEIFAREFGFDLERMVKLKSKKYFGINFSDIAIYHSLRDDIKHQKNMPVFKKVLRGFDCIKLSDISLNEPMYGANEAAKEGQKGVDIRYIRITDINFAGDLIDDDWKTAENIEEKYLLKNDDFLFARSGNTVGKSFLYDSKKHEESIFAGYFIKFCLDFSKIDKYYFLYYTKSFLFELWRNGIMRIKGQPNINADEYSELIIPDLKPQKQQEIVSEIKAELDRQEGMKKKIEAERNKIDEIIEKAVS